MGGIGHVVCLKTDSSVGNSEALDLEIAPFVTHSRRHRIYRTETQLTYTRQRLFRTTPTHKKTKSMNSMIAAWHSMKDFNHPKFSYFFTRRREEARRGRRLETTLCSVFVNKYTILKDYFSLIYTGTSYIGN